MCNREQGRYRYSYILISWANPSMKYTHGTTVVLPKALKKLSFSINFPLLLLLRQNLRIGSFTCSDNLNAGYIPKGLALKISSFPTSITNGSTLFGIFHWVMQRLSATLSEGWLDGARCFALSIGMKKSKR